MSETETKIGATWSGETIQIMAIALGISLIIVVVFNLVGIFGAIIAIPLVVLGVWWNGLFAWAREATTSMF